MAFKLVIAFTALAGISSAAVTKRVACPNSKNTAVNPACCIFHDLKDTLVNDIFDNQCGEDAHEVLRLSFHDAIGFSFSGTFKGTGADGSMLIFNDTEVPFSENAGIDDSVATLKPLLAQFPTVTAGDLIQFAAAVGVAQCPGAPKLQFLAGRPNAKFPASDGTVPLPEDPIDKILNRMADAGFSPQDLVSLLASHTIARSDTLAVNRSAVPFDTTPFTFDSQVFLEVLLAGNGFPGGQTTPGAEAPSPLAAEGEMRLHSDFLISRDPRTSCFWQGMINEQTLMANSFKAAMAKLAVTGQNISSFIDCSEAVPAPPPAVKKPTTYPASKSFKDIQQACPLPFPVLATDPGPATVIPECINGDTNIADCPS